MSLMLAKPVELETTDCCVCGVVFAIPARMLENLREQAGSITCPSGHRLTWAKNEAAKLRDELAAEKRRKDAALARANEADEARLKAEATLARLKKRQQAGVCPCCNRTFSNVQRHMASKHPAPAA
jgi:beta-phosphoglucomutase-like phosphatase (HAD superfamily)